MTRYLVSYEYHYVVAVARQVPKLFGGAVADYFGLL